MLAADRALGPELDLQIVPLVSFVLDSERSPCIIRDP